MKFQNDDPFEQMQSPFGVDSSKEKKSTPWWGWFFVVLCGAIPAVALGGALPVLIGVCGVSACLAVARNLRSSPLVGATVCLGISIACWGAFAAVLALVFVIQGGDLEDVARQFAGRDEPVERLAQQKVPNRRVDARRPNQPVAEPISLATRLITAINSPNVADLQRVLDAGADPNQPDRRRYPLVVAVQLRRHAATSVLLEFGADPNRPGGNEFPLAVAVQAADEALVELLCQYGAEPNASTIQGQSLLGYALGRNMTGIAELLSRNGAILTDAKPGHFTTAVSNKNQLLLDAILASGYQFTVNDISAIEQVIRTGTPELFDRLLKQGLSSELQSPSGQPLLHVAVVAKRPEIVQLLLKQGADPNRTNRAGETPLSLAARARDIAVTSLLLASEVRVNELDSMGKTALHHAVLLDAPQVVELLVKYGANIHQADRGGTTPLMLGVSRARPEVLRNLLSQNPDLEQTDSSGRTIVQSAVQRADREVLALLLEAGAPVNAVGNSKNTPLALAIKSDLDIATLLANNGAVYSADGKPIVRSGFESLRGPFLRAAEEGYSAVVAALLDAGLPIDLVETRLKEQAIHKAAAAGQLEVVQLLLDRGADYDVPDTRSETPLFLALREKHDDVARLLMEAGADPLRRLPNNGTLLHLAARIDRPELIEKLLELGAEIEATDGVGLTPLLWAADTDSNDACEALLAAGANVKVTEGSGASLVEVAVRRGNETLAKLFMEKGANVKDDRLLFQAISSWRGNDRLLKSLLANGAELDRANSAGDTPLLYALRKRRFDAAKILLAQGASVDVADKDGRTPLHWAVLQKSLELTELVLDAGADVAALDSRGVDAIAAAQQVKLVLPAEIERRLKSK